MTSLKINVENAKAIESTSYCGINRERKKERRNSAKLSQLIFNFLIRRQKNATKMLKNTHACHSKLNSYFFPVHLFPILPNYRAGVSRKFSIRLCCWYSLLTMATYAVARAEHRQQYNIVIKLDNNRECLWLVYDHFFFLRMSCGSCAGCRACARWVISTANLLQCA